MGEVQFGTSGLRGPAEALLDGAAKAHALGFAKMLKTAHRVADGAPVFIGEDRRNSSPALAKLCAQALVMGGLTPVRVGQVPTPALALHTMAQGAPCLMVTGSHIPADRNGLKFYRPDGEIDKADEAAIREASLLQAGVQDSGSHAVDEMTARVIRDAYLARYRNLFPDGFCAGLRIGIHDHSSVGTPWIAEILEGFGAQVFRFGGSDTFVAVDTEAVPQAMLDDIRAQAHAFRLDAVISTDGDADRPFVADEQGQQVRGDALGLLCARQLNATTLVTPVTSNSALEDQGAGIKIVRTKVGSPFVIAAMAETAAGGAVIGFEANGGVLTGRGLTLDGHRLDPLPTRDSTLPILTALLATVRAGQPLSQVVSRLGLRAAASNRLKDFPVSRSLAILRHLRASDENRAAFVAKLGSHRGAIARIEDIDGLQIFLTTKQMIHVRPSGNAPELRCYAEAETISVAQSLMNAGLECLAAWPEPLVESD